MCLLFIQQVGWGLCCRCSRSYCSRTVLSTGYIEACTIALSTQHCTSCTTPGKCRRHMPVMHFTPSMAFSRVYRITSMYSCSRCTKCSTWRCMWLLTSGRCLFMTATSKYQRYFSRLSMALHTTLTTICTIRATMVSTSLCGIGFVALSAIQADLRAADRLTTS